MNSIKFLDKYQWRMIDFGFSDDKCRELSVMVSEHAEHSKIDVSDLFSTLWSDYDD